MTGIKRKKRVDHPYLKNVSERLKRIASRHSFRVALFKPGRKLKEIKSTCQEPSSVKDKYTLYTKSYVTVKILCTLERHGVCFRPEKNEYISKVRLSNRDMAQGKLSSVEQRMGKEDRGLARHCVECSLLSVIVRVSVVVKRTFVADND